MTPPSDLGYLPDDLEEPARRRLAELMVESAPEPV